MTDVVKAWQCIGCGNLDAAQTCIGICDYRKVEFVHAQDHEQALHAERRASHRAELLADVVRQLARTTPRDGEWQRSYVAMQARARSVLSALAEPPES
jgi:hypothetical protein